MANLTAVEIIGENTANDYIIQPEIHADFYRQSAPGLAAILDGTNIAAVVKNYVRQNDDANNAQNEYQTAANRSNWAVLLASLLGGLSMSLQIVLDRGSSLSWLATAVSVATAIVGAVGGFWVYLIRQNQLLENWMKSRAKAESTRIDLFSEISNATADSDNAATLELLLEYFRRYQFDVQSNFYRSRQKDHERSARKTTTIGAIGTGVSALAAIGVAGDLFSTSGIFGIAGAALIAFSVAREQLTQDRRNAERYGRTLDVLVEIEKRLSAVRAAAAKRQSQPVVELIAAVNEQCSLEHRQWLELGEGAKQGLARLEASLKAATKPKNP